MFDSREYEWSDITLVLGKRDITGIRGVKYSEEIELEPLFAKGRHAHSIQRGNIACKGELTVLQSELEAMIKAGKGSLFNLKGLNAIVSYGNLANGDAITTDRIESIYFSISEKELQQGAKFMEVKLSFLATRVAHQVK